jgi:hypothetical protein
MCCLHPEEYETPTVRGIKEKGSAYSFAKFCEQTGTMLARCFSRAALINAMVLVYSSVDGSMLWVSVSSACDSNDSNRRSSPASFLCLLPARVCPR